MPEACTYCSKPVFLSKDSYRTQHVQKNGEWVRLIYHVKCDPFRVSVKVTKR